MWVYFIYLFIYYLEIAHAMCVKNVRALSSGLSNVSNAKYLAHLTNQTQKQVLIRNAKCAKIIEHATARSHF